MARPGSFLHCSEAMLFVALPFLFATPAGWAQLAPQESFGKLRPADDVEVRLFAHEPDLVAPTAMDIDEAGRVWIVEGVNYRKAGGPRINEPPYFPRPLRKSGDRVVVLEDTDGDGRADTSRVFYEGLDINSPQGFAVFGGKVWISQSPNIFTIDILPDGTAGEKKIFLSGFGGIHGDHSVHSVYLGPDGKLYGCFGNTHTVLSLPDGRKIDNWQRGTHGGVVFRMNLDATGFEVLGFNFRNGYECATDSFGTTFYSDNDDDEGNQYCRLVYVMQGGNFGHQPQPPRGLDWNMEQPGVVPILMRTGAGAPAGLCVYEGTLLAEKYRGMPMLADTGSGLVECFRLEPDGAGFRVAGAARDDGGRQTIETLREIRKPDLLLASDDPWFRPSDVAVAPDGSLFIADFYNRIAGGRRLDDELRGRIYRIVPKGSDGRYQCPKFDVATPEGLIAALGSPNLALRSAAILRIRELGEEALPLLERVVAEVARLRSAEEEGDNGQSLATSATATSATGLHSRLLYQLGMLGDAAQSQVRAALEDPDPNIRVAAVRSLRQNADDRPNILQSVANDESAQVRREVLLALRGIDGAAAGDLVIELAKQYDGRDRFYLEAVLIALRGKEKELVPRLLESVQGTWNRRLASYLWALRPPDALARLTAVAQDEDRSPEDRLIAVEALGKFNDVEAGRALADLLVSEPQVPRPIVREALRAIAAKIKNRWKELADSAELLKRVEAYASDEDLQAPAMKLARALGTRPLRQWLLSPAFPAPGGSGFDSAFEPENAKTPERGDGWTAADLDSAGIVDLARQRSPNNNVAAYGVSLVHAEGPLETRLLAGSDDGIQLWLNGKLVHQHRVTRGVGPRQDIVPVRFEAGLNRLMVKIDQGTGGWGFVVEVEDPFNKLSEVTFAETPLVVPDEKRLDPKQLPPDSEVLAIKGNAAAGRDVFLRSKSACARCHALRGEGGLVSGLGPALDGVGKKMGRDALLESILRPSRKIDDKFAQWIVLTGSGTTHTGILADETPETIVLIDAEGRRTTLAKSDIATKQRSPASPMPENLVGELTQQQVADLLEYLARQK